MFISQQQYCFAIIKRYVFQNIPASTILNTEEYKLESSSLIRYTIFFFIKCSTIFLYATHFSCYTALLYSQAVSMPTWIEDSCTRVYSVQKPSSSIYDYLLEKYTFSAGTNHVLLRQMVHCISVYRLLTYYGGDNFKNSLGYKGTHQL